MVEIVANIHMHTRYSDGTGLHKDIAEAALEAGVDVVYITDHNILVKGMERYYSQGKKRVLVLVGEEVHDQDRNPQKNHLLILGTNHELATYADDPQILIQKANEARALTFLAHPTDPAAPRFGEDDLSWVSWDVRGFTGIELWNHLSELKRYMTGYPNILYHIYNPERVAVAPFEDVLNHWDELTRQGLRVVAIGGSDAHAIHGKLGPLRRDVFPYSFHFRCINTHLLLPEPLSGDFDKDKAAVLSALKQGHAFVGYDLPAPTRGFRFSAQGGNGQAVMGDEIALGSGVTLQVRLPERCECNLVLNGRVIKTWEKRENFTHIATEPGVYRVEAYRQFLGQRRGWIFSNPIYLRA